MATDLGTETVPPLKKQERTYLLYIETPLGADYRCRLHRETVRKGPDGALFDKKPAPDVNFTFSEIKDEVFAGPNGKFSGADLGAMLIVVSDAKSQQAADKRAAEAAERVVAAEARAAEEAAREAE